MQLRGGGNSYSHGRNTHAAMRGREPQTMPHPVYMYITYKTIREIEVILQRSTVNYFPQSYDFLL